MTNSREQALQPQKHGLQVPGPGMKILFRIPELRRDPLGFFRNLSDEFDGFARVRMPGFHFYLVTRPDYVKHILQDNQRNYIKGASVELARVLVGNGLATSDGELWLEQRRLMQPAFHRRRLADLADQMIRTGEVYLDQLGASAREGSSVDISSKMMDLTLQVIVRTMFSQDISDQTEELAESFNEALRYIDRRSFSGMATPLWLPTPANLRFKRALRTLDSIVNQVVIARQETQSEQHDLLAMLLGARDAETGLGMSPSQLRDEIVTLFFAGHETTALTLTWALVELMDNPVIATRVDDEIDRVLQGRSPTLDDLQRLSFTRLVLDETLRMYPPAWIFARSSVEADRVGNFELPPGANILLSPYVTHRDETFWPQPDTFDPDRFDREIGRQGLKTAYYPFGAGPRLCIGRDFALMEAVLLLAMLRQRFVIAPAPEFDARPVPLVTLRPRGQVRVTLEARSSEPPARVQHHSPL